MSNLSAVERLRAVLCDPEGKCCIAGSDEDRRIIDDTLADIEELVASVRKLRTAYSLARNSAAGFSNLCEDTASARACERELDKAEKAYDESKIAVVIARIGGAA